MTWVFLRNFTMAPLGQKNPCKSEDKQDEAIFARLTIWCNKCAIVFVLYWGAIN
jgi:hypothetical protein